MPNEHAMDTAILIPSYQPDGKLAPYVQALREAGFAKSLGGIECYAAKFNS